MYALEKKKGDCTEHASLFAALCRANNFQARMMGGYYCEGNCSKSPTFHMWAEFYADGRWHLADPFSGNFDDKYKFYRALENFFSDSLKPMGNFHRYYLEILPEDQKDHFKITSEYIIS